MPPLQPQPTYPSDLASHSAYKRVFRPGSDSGERHALPYSRCYVTYIIQGLGINNDFVGQETSDIVRFWHKVDGQL
jgi:hypothetical protein